MSDISFLALLLANKDVSFLGKCTLDREGDFSKPSNPAAALETKARCRRTGASLYLPTEGRAHRHTEENACSGTSAHTSHM